MQKSESYSYWIFIKKRFLRIYPSLLVMLFSISLASFFLLDPLGTSQDSFKTSLSALFSISNWFLFLSGNNYFGTPIQSNTFMHTWSLAIEMQFYLIFPLLLKYFNKISIPIIRKNRICPIFCTISVQNRPHCFFRG